MFACSGKQGNRDLLLAAKRYTGGVSETLVINEIYLSLQGESTWAGLPCIFIRLTACDLRCSYCDTAYAFTEGKKRTCTEILAAVNRLAKPFSNVQRSTLNAQLPLVELTGGEPLLQKNSLPLMKQLCDDGFTVLLETSGAHDISPVDPRVRRIMDLKCPGSGEADRNFWDNLRQLKDSDEIKFVIGPGGRSSGTGWSEFVPCCSPGRIRWRRNNGIPR